MKYNKKTRRRWLAACAGATVGTSVLAGCASDSDDGLTPNVLGSDGDFGSWPMVHYDAANRLSVPYSGVSGKPDVRWTVELEIGTEPPVVYDDIAYVSHGYEIYSAVDLVEGEILWDHETDGHKALAVSDAGLFVAGDGLEALDREEGDVLWTSGHEETVTSIRLFDDLIYAGLDDSVVVFDEEGEEELEFDTPDPVQSLAIDEERVYVRCREDPDVDDFVMLGFDRTGGEKLWEHEISHGEQWSDDRMTRTFPVIDSTVYTVTREEIIGISGATGDVDDAVELDSSSWTRPTIHDGVAYVERGSRAYDLETEDEPDGWDPDSGSDSPHVVADNTLHSTRPGGINEPFEMVAKDSISAETKWVIDAPEFDNYNIPVVLDGLILVAMDTTGLAAFS